MHLAFRTLGLAGALLVLLVFSACGKDRSVGTAIAGSNQAGVDVSVTFKRFDPKWAIGTLRLTNVSEKAIQLKDFTIGSKFPTCTLVVANSAPVPAVCENTPGNFIEIPAGVSYDLVMKWQLVGRPAKNSPWTLTIAGLAQDGKALPDVVINRSTL